MIEQNQMLVRRGIEEICNRGNLAMVDELAADDFVMHLPSAEINGPEKAKEYVAALRGAFPDLRVTIEDQVAEGDKVVTRWVARGTPTGAFQGIPPTGKQGQVTGINIDRIAGGKDVE
jgi:steroid delta-isomerase-like uncharacterized protein